MTVINGVVPEGQNLTSSQKAACSYQRIRPFLALCLKITVTSVLPQTLGFKYNFDCPSLCFILLIVYHLQFSPIKLAVESP